MALPLFNDEAVYLLRAQRFPAMLMADPRSSSATLPEGKLLQELCLALLARLPGDPLLPARLLSVLCGLGTVLVMIQIGRQLACPGCGMLAGLLYALSPLAQIHDRLAISDSMLTMVGAGLLLVSVRYATNEQADRGQALGIGALLGTAALVKLTGILLAALPVLAVLLLTPANQRRGRIALLRLSIIVALLPIAALAPFHYGGAERQKIGTETSRILLAWQNIKHIASWLTQYLPVPLLLIPLAALGVGHWRQQPKDSAQKGLRQTVAFLLVAGLALPLTLIGLGGSLASRYILPAWPGLLVAIGLGSKLLWEQSDRRWPGRMLVIVSLGLAGLWGSFFDLRYSSDPQSAPLDTADRWQYTQSWTAAYALNPLLDEIRQIAADQGPITLILHDQSRLASLAGLIYLEREPDIEIVVIDMSRIDAPEQITALDHHKPTYLLADSQVVETYRLHTRFPMLVPLQAEANPGGEISFWLFQL